MAQDRRLFTNPGAYGGAVPRVRAPQTHGVADAIGNVAEAFTDVTAAFYEADQRDRILKAKVLIGERFSQLETDLAQTTSVVEAERLFAERSQQIREDAARLASYETDERGEPIPGDERTLTAIDLAYRQQATRASANVKRNAFAAQVKAHNIGLMQRLSQIEAEAMAAPDTDMAEAKAEAFAEIDADVAAGFLHEADALEEKAKFAARLDYNRASLLVASNPALAYEALMETDEEGAPAAFADMDGNQRRSLIVQALGQMPRAEMREQQEIKARQEQARKDMMELWLQGELDEETLLANKDALSGAVFGSLARLVASGREDPSRDDPSAVTDIYAEIYSDNPDHDAIYGRIVDEARKGNLTGSTVGSLLSTNDQVRRRHGIATPHDAAQKHISMKLGSASRTPGDIAGEQREAEARREYDMWAEQNPNATLEEAYEQANHIISRWVLVDFSNKALGLRIPDGITTPRSDLTTADILERARELEIQYATGQVSDDYYQQQKPLLTQWYEMLRERERDMPEETNGPSRRR